MDFVKFLGIVIILFCGFLTSKAFFRGFAPPSRLLSEAEGTSWEQSSGAALFQLRKHVLFAVFWSKDGNADPEIS